MSRVEIREQLVDAILRSRATARRTKDVTLSIEELTEAIQDDDGALSDVLRLLRELG